MTLLTFGLRTCPPPCSASRLGRLKNPPSSDSAPALSVSRRVTPSPHGRGVPRIEIIVPLHPERRPAGGMSYVLLYGFFGPMVSLARKPGRRGTIAPVNGATTR